MDAAGLVMADFRAVEGPQIVSTVPESGVPRIDPWLGAAEFRFSEPMKQCYFQSSGGFWFYTLPR